MFSIQAQFEDCKLHAESNDGKEYQLQVEDSFEGEISETLTITALQLSYILQFYLDNYGEPEGFEKMYESLEPLFKDWPVNLRPIP